MEKFAFTCAFFVQRYCDKCYFQLYFWLRLFVLLSHYFDGGNKSTTDNGTACLARCPHNAGSFSNKYGAIEGATFLLSLSDSPSNYR